MRYRMIKNSRWDSRVIVIEKHMESKGFFHNATGPSRVGGIAIYNSTEDGRLEDFLTKEDGTYYMILGCHDEFGLIYRDDVPLISIGDKKHNIPVEDRIEFLYESLSSNIKYECLGIIYKGSDIFGHNSTLFRIEFIGYDDGVFAFNISD